MAIGFTKLVGLDPRSEVFSTTEGSVNIDSYRYSYYLVINMESI